MEPFWYITLFQELTLCPIGSDAVARRFRSQKVAGLLAFLAYHRGRTFSREVLCELLWMDEDPAISRNRLRVTIASLRRQLEPPHMPFGTVLETLGNNKVGLRKEAVQTDVALFEDAVHKKHRERATELYRGGPLLPTVYDNWVFGERERLEQSYDSIRWDRGSDQLPSLPSQGLAPTPATTRSTSCFLPVYLTRFIGREAECAQIQTLFTDGAIRLITLTGSGGNGKTRLATEVMKNDPSLLAFVSLADVWDAERLGEVLRQALALPVATQKQPLSQVIAHLRERSPCRIVLDNLEQIVMGAAPLVAELLTQVPNLSLLITSRRRLEIPGERELFLSPLVVPTGEDPAEVAATSSVRLFLDRAQGIVPDFQVTARNVSEIVGLCCLLDGVPLAIELAAARVGTLSPAQLYASLRERLTDLSANSRDSRKEERHRSLNAVIGWSFALMPPDLRRFFQAVSVFRGGWEARAAEAVTEEAHAMDSLSRLRAHSLITLQEGRFHFLETLRIWARERLSEPERDALAIRHARYFATFGEAMIARTGGADEKEALDELVAEDANLRAAFEFALGKTDGETALRLALVRDSLGRARGSLRESLDSVESALNLSTPIVNHELQARALIACGTMHQFLGNLTPARFRLEAALPLARRSPNRRMIARILRCLADNAVLEKQYLEAQALFDEALVLQRELSDERGIAQTLNSLGFLWQQRGEFEQAFRAVQESADYFRRVGDQRMLSYNLSNIADLERQRGNFAEAETLYLDSMTIARAENDDWHCLEVVMERAAMARLQNQNGTYLVCIQQALPFALRLQQEKALSTLLQAHAEVAVTDCDWERAAMLLAASRAQPDHIDTVREAEDEKIFNQLCSTIRSSVGARPFRAFWKKGAVLSRSQAVALAMQ